LPGNCFALEVLFGDKMVGENGEGEEKRGRSDIPSIFR